MTFIFSLEHLYPATDYDFQERMIIEYKVKLVGKIQEYETWEEDFPLQTKTSLLNEW